MTQPVSENKAPDYESTDELVQHIADTLEKAENRFNNMVVKPGPTSWRPWVFYVDVFADPLVELRGSFDTDRVHKDVLVQVGGYPAKDIPHDTLVLDPAQQDVLHWAVAGLHGEMLSHCQG